MARRRGGPKTQLDRIERTLTKVAAHTYGGVDPDDGAIVTGHRQRLDAIEAKLGDERDERRHARLRKTIWESTKLVGAAIAGALGGHAAK